VIYSKYDGGGRHELPNRDGKGRHLVCDTPQRPITAGGTATNKVRCHLALSHAMFFVNSLPRIVSFN